MARSDANLKIGADTKQATQAIKKLNRDLAAVKLDSLINLGSRAKDAGSSLIQLAGGFQQVKLTLEKVTGGEGYAKFSEISAIAGKTQFDVIALSEAFVKLQTAGVDGATDKLTQFADIAAVTTDQIGSLNAITDLFARTTAGGLGLEDLNRLADRGIPVWRVLSDELGLNRLELSKYGQSAEGASEITETLLAVLSSKYAGTASEQANTVAVAWSNAGMKVDELTSAIMDSSGLTNAFISLAHWVGEASVALTEFWSNQDQLLTLKGMPLDPSRLEATSKRYHQELTKLVKMKEKMKKFDQVSINLPAHPDLSNQQELVDSLAKLYATDLTNYRKAQDAKVRAYSTSRKARIASAFSDAFGGDDTSKQGIDEKTKKQQDKLNKIKEDGLIVGNALDAKWDRAMYATKLANAMAHAKLKTELRKKWEEEDKHRMFENLSTQQQNLITAVEYTKRLRESENELLDRLAEARLANTVGYLEEETQALIRKHDFEIKLEERLASRKQKLREVEFRNKGFGTNASKQMAQDEADYNKKTETEKAQWAIQQGATALDALGQHSRKAFELAKAFNIANAIMNTMTGVTKALAQGGVFGLITGAVVLATGLANVATIRAQQYQGRQFGGTVTGNKPYMVGEKGPELFVPGKTGSIVNNGELQNGSTTNITFEINAVDASGVDELIAERQDMIIGMIRNAHEDAGYDARL